MGSWRCTRARILGAVVATSQTKPPWIYPATKRSSSADRGAGRDRRPGPTDSPRHARINTRAQRHTRPALARLIGQLGDPSAQISGAPADRAVVGMPADAAAVTHREGVLPGGKKRPQFLSKLVHVLHGCLRSWSRGSRRRRLAPRVERRRRLPRYIRPDKVGWTCGRPPRRRAAPPAVVVPLDNIGAGTRPSSPTSPWSSSASTPPPLRPSRDDPIALPSTWVIARIAAKAS